VNKNKLKMLELLQMGAAAIAASRDSLGNRRISNGAILSDLSSRMSSAGDFPAALGLWMLVKYLVRAVGPEEINRAVRAIFLSENSDGSEANAQDWTLN